MAIGLVVLLLVGCGSPAGSPRPTDPREIAVEAVRATAGLPTLRLHLELVSATASQSGATLDADIDLANRQLAGRMTTSFRAVPGDVAQEQFLDWVITADAVYTRNSGAVRWHKVTSIRLAEIEPTNAAVAAAIAELLANERLTYEKLDTVDCTLGSCDQVIVHVDGAAAAEALSRLLGHGGDGAGSLPNVDIAIRVDQSSSVISELRANLRTGDTPVQLLVTLTNPGAAIRIVAPDPTLVDDMTGGGFDGAAATPAPIAVPATAAPAPTAPPPSR
jgi:hypothetical protein